MKAIKAVSKGIAAGFLTTGILSALMLTKQLAPPTGYSRRNGWDRLGLCNERWLADTLRRLAVALPRGLFGVGQGWMYAVMEPMIPGGRPWRKGLYFGFTTGLLAWLIALPLAGAGLFGMRLSAAQPLVTLVQHLVYGLVLAVTYDLLRHSGIRRQTQRA